METRIEELLDDRRVAVLMGASRRMLQVWRQQGRGPSYVRVGRLIRYKPSAIAEYLEQQSVRHSAAVTR